MKIKTFCFDLDNTLCFTKKNNYEQSKPNKRAIKTINSLFNKGYFIKIHTARYMGRSKDKLKNKKKLHLKISKQLKFFGIKYHKLFISKPSADIYIDDKGFGYDNSWIKKFRNYE
jgi:FMN phosphatase YigB (HAD superfamily)|tara:strand:+ start:1062 stop:1406 length:345 start_codon:yes stop_codon:yes gene_type:complete